MIDSHYPPVTAEFSNNTTGEGLTYQWTFNGGTPSSFEGKIPPKITFTEPGIHTVTLTVYNGFETLTKTDTIEVLPYVAPSFSWEVAHEDYDYQASVKITLSNTTQSAIAYQWIFEGGSPETSTATTPTVTFNNAGTFKISLTASNGKMSKKLEKTITIYPNTGIYHLKDIKLGINYSHNTQHIPAFYSTLLRRGFLSSEVTAAVAPFIDIVFFGQSNTFSYNKFISPTESVSYAFNPITGAKNTVFINTQELFSETDFDTMQNDIPLQSLSITHSPIGAQPFNSSLPRIVLFKTADNRKGAIKIKQFVDEGTEKSYILCDIKVQKKQ